MAYKIPASIRTEHEMLRERLQQATRELGDVGEYARQVAHVLEPHFRREEEFALKPLGLIEQAARGITGDMAAVVPLCKRLESELPALVAEHRAILVPLQRLVEASREAAMPKHERFGAALIQHMNVEEQVLYPAVIVLGKAIERALGPASVLAGQFGEDYVS